MFFLHKYIDSLQKAFINPQSLVEHFLWLMDALFWASKSQPPFTDIIKIGRARTFLIQYLSESRKSYTPSMAWGWVYNGVIFIFT